MPQTVTLTGEVISPDELNASLIEVGTEEAAAAEARGEGVIELQGKHYRSVIEPWPDGTIELNPRLDSMGRLAVAGGHTNAGYSGYFKAYLHVDGTRRVLKDFWRLFPNNEHHYARQADKTNVEAMIREKIAAMKGLLSTKVERGWALFSPEGDQA